MDASKKQREPVAFKSLAELKRFIRPGVEFKTVSHANHADMVGADSCGNHGADGGLLFQDQGSAGASLLHLQPRQRILHRFWKSRQLHL